MLRELNIERHKSLLMPFIRPILAHKPPPNTSNLNISDRVAAMVMPCANFFTRMWFHARATHVKHISAWLADIEMAFVASSLLRAPTSYSNVI